uniref:Uncharacterized protein n=1 Tax=Virgibacillus oceani TaxID=1479511 RepID=A0A917HG61_9BACI|nr:hypothetical protein GCM10011398_23310 [Virgibacillus oceani]
MPVKPKKVTIELPFDANGKDRDCNDISSQKKLKLFLKLLEYQKKTFTDLTVKVTVKSVKEPKFDLLIE